LLLACAGLWWVTVSGVLIGQTAAPKPQPSAAPAQAQLESAAKDALLQYSEAYQSLDADQVKRIYPSVDLEGLRRAFRDMRELKVNIDSIRILSTDGASARVSCRVTQTLIPKAGSKHTSAVIRVIRLRKQETVWLIDGFER
jgi:hypothetical protein